MRSRADIILLPPLPPSPLPTPMPSALKLTRKEALWIKNSLTAAKEKEKENIRLSAASSNGTIEGGKKKGGGDEHLTAAAEVGDGNIKRRSIPRKVIPASGVSVSGGERPPTAAPLNEYELEREVSSCHFSRAPGVFFCRCRFYTCILFFTFGIYSGMMSSKANFFHVRLASHHSPCKKIK